MAAADVDVRPSEEPAAAVPDYLASPNAVFADADVKWRYGTPPDYSKTRAVWENTKSMNHVAGSLPQLVENLVKNWEVEASFKPRLEDWRTIDHANYSFAINGGPAQTAEHMLKVGTYNAIITANEFYDPESSDFASSHKTFKRMMPTFAWEVLEVYSGPPKVAFRWRHWGDMKNDYVGFNNQGQKITAKAHGGKIDVEGVTVAEVDDKVRLRKVETWFDPMAMFRQIAPQGIVNKQIVDTKIPKDKALDDLPVNDGVKIAQEHNSEPQSTHKDDAPASSVLPKDISPSTGLPADQFVPNQGTVAARTGINESPEAQHVLDKASEVLSASAAEPAQTNGHSTINGTQNDPSSLSGTRAVSDSSDKTWERIERPEEEVTTAPHMHDFSTEHELKDKPKDVTDAVRSGRPEEIAVALQGEQTKDMENAVRPEAGEAVVVPASSEEVRLTHEEMSKISPMECPFLMNRE